MVGKHLIWSQIIVNAKRMMVGRYLEHSDTEKSFERNGIRFIMMSFLRT